MKNTAAKPPIVRLQNVSKRFIKSLDVAAKIAQKLGANIREEVVHAVDDVSLSIAQGEVVGLPGNPDAASRLWAGWWPGFFLSAMVPFSIKERM